MYDFVFFGYVWVTEWPPIGEMAAHLATYMIYQYKNLIVNLVFSYYGFWSGNCFLIASFSDHCLLFLFEYSITDNVLMIIHCSCLTHI